MLSGGLISWLVWGLGFRVLGFRGLRFRVLGFRVLGFRVLGFKMPDGPYPKTRVRNSGL